MTMDNEKMRQIADFVEVAINEGGIALLKELEGQEVDKDQLIAVLANELRFYHAGYFRLLDVSNRLEALLDKIFSNDVQRRVEDLLKNPELWRPLDAD